MSSFRVKPFGSKKDKKNPPILSHEFVIQNHADIVSCVAMVFVVGLMMQVSVRIPVVPIASRHFPSTFNQDQQHAQSYPSIIRDFSFIGSPLPSPV